MDDNVIRYSKKHTREEVKKLIFEELNSLDDNQLENIANSLYMTGEFLAENGVFFERPFGNNIEHRNSFREIKKGDSVIVIPRLSNMHKTPFKATVVGYKPKETLVVIVDKNDNAYDVPPDSILPEEEQNPA